MTHLKTVYKTMDLITYGCGIAFEPERFVPVTNRLFVKPHGGLWASPVDSEYGWKDWCEGESYGDLSTWFTFQLTGQIFVIDSLKDAKAMPWLYPFSSLKNDLFAFPDFEQIAAAGVDAIHLTERGQHQTRFSQPSLYGWDCECVLVMNPDCVQILEATNG